MIQCHATYNERMKKPLAEKLFFLDRLPEVDVFVDFGCADGAVLGAIAENYSARGTGRLPGLIGYDLSLPQVMMARACHGDIGAEFYDTLDVVRESRRRKGGTGCLILSSVIHEIMSQGTDWAAFCDLLFSLDCKYIAVRDMGVDNYDRTARSCPMDVARVRRRPGMARLLESFEARWGDIGLRANLTHFLLKYRWEYNWAHEVEENYVAVANQDWLRLFPSPYRVTYFEHAPLPHVQEVVQRDFGITLDAGTHIKMIWERAAP